MKYLSPTALSNLVSFVLINLINLIYFPFYKNMAMFSCILFFSFWNWNWRFHEELILTLERCSMNQGLNDENLINGGGPGTSNKALRISLWNLKSDSHLPKKIFLFASMIAFKNDEKCFLSYLKNFFRSKIFKFLSWLFGHVEKTAWLER